MALHRQVKCRYVHTHLSTSASDGLAACFTAPHLDLSLGTSKFRDLSNDKLQASHLGFDFDKSDCLPNFSRSSFGIASGALDFPCYS